MTRIIGVEIYFVDLPPKKIRTDSIQSFEKQETPIVRIVDSDGVEGIGYCYTIGTGGSSVCSLLVDHLLPKIIGEDSNNIEAIWRKLKFSTNATMVGPITALALAAIDIALWDMRCRRTHTPLSQLAGGARPSSQLYSSECGWLQIPIQELVDGALEAKDAGFLGVKVKVGKEKIAEDLSRLEAVRAAVGDSFEIMVDCNQVFKLDEAMRRARAFEPYNLAWMEEPLPADDVSGHVTLARSTQIPIAVGESIYSIQQFVEFMRRDGCSVVQVDVARIGGISPWLKVAHAADCFNMAVAPHFMMELHASLVCGTQSSRWVEFIPQLDDICTSTPLVIDGRIEAPISSDIGIQWDWSEIKRRNKIEKGKSVIGQI